MQDLIEQLIRGIGFGVLWLVTFGRYRSHDGLVVEGAVGLLVVAAVAWVSCRLAS